MAALPNSPLVSVEEYLNTAYDPDVPPQTLTYTLAQAPANAGIDVGSGVIAWRPGVITAGTSNRFTVKVADNGVRGLSATQSFAIRVNPLLRPTAGAPSWSGGIFRFQVQGDFGPDYFIQRSTNLSNPSNWSMIWASNSPSVPFVWTASNASDASALFYRVLVGP